jgi:hypothetical protein
VTATFSVDKKLKEEEEFIYKSPLVIDPMNREIKIEVKWSEKPDFATIAIVKDSYTLTI